MVRQIRDHIQSPVSLDYFSQRTAEGWKLKAIEWERDDDEEEAAAPEAPPYGLELVPETARLQARPEEAAVLRAILEMTVMEMDVAHIAAELNTSGYATRAGKPWTPAAVFNLLPRLIEAAPDIIKSEDWRERHSKAALARKSL